MRASLLGFAVTVTAFTALAGGAAGKPAPTTQPAPDAQTICQMVVSAEPGTKPYQVCMTKAEWEAKRIADAQDANRIVCHYEEVPGTRFRSARICMSASQWEARRLDDRQAVEHLQMQTCVGGAGC